MEHIVPAGSETLEENNQSRFLRNVIVAIKRKILPLTWNQKRNESNVTHRDNYFVA